MVWNIIPTKVRISQTIPSSHLDTTCFLCSFPIDSLFHLFFTCPIARVVWHQSFWPTDILALNVTNMIDWLLIIFNLESIGILKAESHMFQIFAAVACDQLWFTMNKAHHEDLVPNALVISATIDKIVLEHHSAWTSTLVRNLAVWKKLCSPFFKINYDTAICGSFSAQAAVCRNSSGSIIQWSYLISPQCTAIYGETLAALLAVRLALSLRTTSFILKGDSLTIILALQNSTISQGWRIASTNSHIHSFIPPTTSWTASRVNRSVNFCTHHVVNWIATRLHSDCILIL
jgi:hypothetical protein